MALAADWLEYPLFSSSGSPQQKRHFPLDQKISTWTCLLMPKNKKLWFQNSDLVHLFEFCKSGHFDVQPLPLWRTDLITKWHMLMVFILKWLLPTGWPQFKFWTVGSSNPETLSTPDEMCWAELKTRGVISVGIGIPAFVIRAPKSLPTVPNSSTFIVSTSDMLPSSPCKSYCLAT